MVPASAHDGHVKRLAKGIETLRCIGRRTTAVTADTACGIRVETTFVT